MVVNIAIAFFLDLLLGVPRFSAHPVRLIGWMLSAYERLFYPVKMKVAGGLLLALASLGSVFAVMTGLMYLAPFFELPLSINGLLVILLFFLFCNREMVREANEVRDSLLDGRIEDARKQVARIVGRDTQRLDRAAIIRATVESVAENIVDGFTAPLFYLLIGGVPLAYVYKTANTIDSRFGYRSERYEKFGKVGARLDDALNFIPARLNVFFLLCAVGFDRRVLEAVEVYGRRHPSPNSGLAEAGFAGHLGIALGGPSLYGGALKEKPWIGENRVALEALEDPRLIERAVALYWRVVWVTLCAALAAAYFLHLPLLFV